MSERPISSASNLLEFFRDELTAAFEMLGITTSPHTEAYVVQLLDGFTRPDAPTRAELGFGRPAALMLGDAVHSGGERRIEAYRRLGDSCLVHCGFFAPTLERRGMSERYYQQMGRNAYGDLCALMGYKQPGGVFHQIFDELARHFGQLAAALKRVAGTPDTRTELETILERLTKEDPEPALIARRSRHPFDVD